MSKQRHLSEYVEAPAGIFREGQALGLGLYIYLPQNTSIVFFRRAGDLLSAEDCSKIEALPQGTLLILRSEKSSLYSQVSTEISERVRKGQINSPEVRLSAEVLLGSLTSRSPESETPSGDHARACLQQLPKLVQQVMSQMPRTASLEAYERVLKKIAQQDLDPISAHNEQVSALSVLILMTFGVKTPDEVALVGTAGLLHDLGLRRISRPVAEKHLIGEEDLTSSEKIVYMRHIELTQEMISESKIVVSEEVLLAVQQHHENFDGSGFRAIPAKIICAAARVLRIADDVVAAISHPKNSFGFREALGFVSSKDRHLPRPIYDPDIMDVLGRLT